MIVVSKVNFMIFEKHEKKLKIMESKIYKNEILATDYRIKMI